MAFIPVASRIGIIIDLNNFEDNIAYFFYNYDLTEVVDSQLTNPDRPNDPSITATVPDLRLSSNPTPYPTPIPDPDNQNQQQNSTNLDYPLVNIIPQKQEVLTHGTIPIPKIKNIKPFLKLLALIENARKRKRV